MLQARPAIQVDAEDVVPDFGQGPSTCFAKTTGRTQDQGPTILANVFRHLERLRVNEMRGRPPAPEPAHERRYGRGL